NWCWMLSSNPALWPSSWRHGRGSPQRNRDLGDNEMHTTPTTESYDTLQKDFGFFNAELFGNSLTPVLFTLVNKANSRGYFHQDHFAAAEGTKCHEISLNPTLFGVRTDKQTLSTLVHEMVHLWQAQYGKPGRGKY